MNCIKIVVVAFAAALSVGAGWAKDFNIGDYGASNDGVTDASKAIQKAIDAAAEAGGGVVSVPAGVFLTGSIYLKSNVELYLEKGSELLASTEPKDYNRADVCPQNWTSDEESNCGQHLVLCIAQTNVAITGSGRINGNSRTFFVGPKGERWPQDAIPFRPAQMLFFVESKDLRFEGFELKDSSYWNLFIYGCENVEVKNLYIHNVREGFHTHNGDGIDIDCSRHVRVSGCRIDTSDDCVTLRASGEVLVNSPQVCSDVRVWNCDLSSACNAIRVGVGNGKVQNARFDDIRISNTRTGVSLVSSWSPESRGVDISDIVFFGFKVESCFEFAQMEPRFAKEALFENIVFENCFGLQEVPSSVIGTAARPAKDIRFRNVSFPHGVYARYAEGLEITGGDFREVKVTDAEIDEYAKRKFHSKLIFWDMLAERPEKLAAPVVGKLSEIGKYAKLNPNFAKAFEFLARKDLAELPPGRYEIDGDNVFAIIQDCEPKAYPQKQGELHRTHIDIHVPIIGNETIGVCDVPNPHLQVRLPFDEKMDVGFYDMPPETKAVDLQPGDFMMAFPKIDLHASSCTRVGAKRLKKVLVKVRL